MIYIFASVLLLLLILMVLMYRFNRLHQSPAADESKAAVRAERPPPVRRTDPEAAEISRNAKVAPSSRGSVLIVDDQAKIRMLLVEVLSACGLEVYEAADGPGAIRLFADNPVDLVLMDLKMPAMDGFETLLQLRRIKPDLMAVMISAYCDPEDLENATQLGITQFFNKPFDIDDLKMHVLCQLGMDGR
ncbi:response regulator [Paenibacillus sp. 1P07SE]|uniref:response regulator n=1 Tax=Paenibacillus sp. 1P07SE TaxID=3132209 RepID=UPI0039A775D0